MTKNNVLKILHLRQNGLYTQGAAALSDMIRKNTSITELNITDNHIGPEGAKEIALHFKGSIGRLLRSVGYDVKLSKDQKK